MLASLKIALLAVTLGSTPQASTASTCSRPEFAARAEDTCPLKPGTQVPDVTLTGADGKPFSLKAELARQPTLLVFYRGGWCPFCNRQLAGLKDVQPELERLGIQLVAISPDTPQKLGESVKKHSLPYRLVSDSQAVAMKAFGLTFKVDDAGLEMLKSYKIDLEAASGQPHHLLPVPAVYLVGTDGLVHFAYANPNYKVRVQPELILAAARAMQPAAKTDAK